MNHRYQSHMYDNEDQNLTGFDFGLNRFEQRIR